MANCGWCGNSILDEYIVWEYYKFHVACYKYFEKVN